MPAYIPPILPDMRDDLVDRSLLSREKGAEVSDDVDAAIVVACCRRISVISTTKTWWWLNIC